MMVCFAAMASAQGYGNDLAVPQVTCADGALYTSELGPLAAPSCTLASLVDVTADECGRACAEQVECWCATHELGECNILAKDCCVADIMKPCRSSVEEQSTFEYVRGGVSGTAYTTRYWDCAKPSCSWPGKAKVTAPPRTCHRDGLTTASPSEKSGAGGGSAFACSDQQPWVSRRNSNVSYGFVAFSTPTGGEARSCCMCLELKFVDPRLAGKRFVVQVINMNGGENGGHIDMAVPGGGIGAVNACLPQWNAGASWGKQYGGLGSNRYECDGLPEQLRAGCRWQYDWLLDVRSDVTYREIVCPFQLSRRTGCTRLA